MRRTLIIILTLITAGIHVYFYTTGPGFTLTGPDKLFTFFLFNALGYLGLLGLLYLPLRLPDSLHQAGATGVHRVHHPHHRAVHHHQRTVGDLVGPACTDRQAG